MKFGKSTLAVCAILALTATAGAAAAGPAADTTQAVHASVTIPDGQPVPIVTCNGGELTPGNYAIGTIQLSYTVQAFQFTPGAFAIFQLGLGLESVKGTAATYPLTLTVVQKQQGAENLILTPTTPSFNLQNSSWADGTAVTIGIPAGVSNDDGTELEGTLQIESSDNHLKTTTTVIVHIKLVHPTACLRLYNFITDEALTTSLTATDVNVNTKGKVTSTNPFGNLSDNVMVVNTCSVPKTFDVNIALDSCFRTNPYDNPGNAVSMFTTAGAIDPDDFFTTAFGTGTPQGQQLTFTNITLAAGNTLLLTVHTSIKKGDLWNGGPSGTFVGFTAGLYQPGTSFGTLLTDVLEANPATASLGYTVK